MEARLNLMGSAVGGKVLKYVTSASKAAESGVVPQSTAELVKIRASQINGCAVCLDMHTKDAAHAGETPVRLNMIAAWREATVFTDAERAALAVTEEGTRIADGAGGVSDETWELARRHFDDDQLVAIVSLVALINAYNRMNAIPRIPAGDYEPGRWG
jgi:AhpD family alkylhydroperoxidase